MKHIRVLKYLFTLEEDFELPHEIFKGITFFAPFVSIAAGTLTVKKGYSWDGNTPQFKYKDVIRFGVPNGSIHPETGKPRTYYASLVHDALYQYFPHHGIDRKSIDLLYLEMLRQSGFKAAGLYYRAVRLFGGIFVNRHLLQKV
jgi:hypothetical protein